MNKNIYYTTQKQLHTIDTIEETTGWKTIWAYTIENNIPKLWFEIEARNDNSTIDEIQTWLDNNGYEDDEFTMFEL